MLIDLCKNYMQVTLSPEVEMDIYIRAGKKKDAEAAITVLRRSITQLCSADHHGDEAEVAGWLANKNISSWAVWIDRDDAIVLVAELAGNIVGVGMMNIRGEILLNYVHPEARFNGISKAILCALEAKARALGLKMCVLESTLTAKMFYVDKGYQAGASGPFHLSKQI